jgi:hypothetical protein
MIILVFPGKLMIPNERHTTFTTPILHLAGLGTARHGWRRGLGLSEDLDDAKFTFVKLVVHFGHIFKRDSMRDHEGRVELSGDDVVVEDLVPVQMNGS